MNPTNGPRNRSFHRPEQATAKEIGMLNVSPSAQKRIAGYFQSRAVSPIRIFFDTGG